MTTRSGGATAAGEAARGWARPRGIGSGRAPGRWAGRALGGLAITLGALALGALAYQAVATEVDRLRYPPPGQLVDVGGYRLHLHCLGAGAPGDPTVLLEAANPGTVSSWVWVQPAVAAAARVCAYDRAGLG